MSNASINERLAKLERAVDNILRFGVVSDVDYAAAKVKVSDGDWQSGWIKWAPSRAGNVSVWSPPSMGERVMILSPQGEVDLARVMPSVFCQSNPPPSDSPTKQIVSFADEGFVSYDLGTGEAVINPPASGEVKIIVGDSVLVLDSDEMTISVGEFKITSNNVLINADKVTIDSDEIGLGGEGGEKVARIGDAVNPQTFKIMEGSDVTRSK